MTQATTHIERITRRLAILAVLLLLAAAGTAAAHGSGSYGGGMMGGSGWGLFGGAMGLWGLLWMGILVVVPLYLAYLLIDSGSESDDDRPLEVLRERYARGELSEEEYAQRRKNLNSPIDRM